MTDLAHNATNSDFSKSGLVRARIYEVTKFANLAKMSALGLYETISFTSMSIKLNIKISDLLLTGS